jgi:hypothetical protein
MNHDRIHAREPTHHKDRWSAGSIVNITEQDGHAVVTVEAETSEQIELTVTVAVRDLFVSRLDVQPDESPVDEPVWYRKKGR